MGWFRKCTLSAPAVCGLAALGLALAGGRVLATDHKASDTEQVKKSTDSYLSAQRKINVTRFDPAGKGPHPAVLFLHGIDGAEKYETIYHLLAHRLAAKGYVVFFVRYFDCFADRPKELKFFRDNVKGHLTGKGGGEPKRLEAAFGDCLTAVSDAVRYVRAQPGVDKDQVGLVGFSLGAFLALSAATRDELKVAAVVDLFGGLPGPLHERAKALPPVLIVHGDQDETVPVQGARELGRLLEKNKAAHELQVYQGVGHMFDDGKGRINWLAALNAEKRATAFLQQHLKRPTRAASRPADLRRKVAAGRPWGRPVRRSLEG
jgi:carboxymethylenebutenolidase